jgi:L-threonylcarbamoyladenylate synthase
VPVAAPSANLFSRPSPTRAAHVLNDLNGRIDLVIDGGATTVGVESTVLDLSRDLPIILRPGAVTLEMLREVLPEVEQLTTVTVDQTGAMRSPGLLEKHYSPRAPLTLYEGPNAAAVLRRDAAAAIERGQHVGVIVSPGVLSAGPPFIVCELGPALADVAHDLYAAMRELDHAGVDAILVNAFPVADGLGMAIADRLRRAAAGRVVHA